MAIFIQLYFFQHIGINNNKNGKKLQVRTKIRRQLDAKEQKFVRPEGSNPTLL